MLAVIVTAPQLPNIGGAKLHIHIIVRRRHLAGTTTVRHRGAEAEARRPAINVDRRARKATQTVVAFKSKACMCVETNSCQEYRNQRTETGPRRGFYLISPSVGTQHSPRTEAKVSKRKTLENLGKKVTTN